MKDFARENVEDVGTAYIEFSLIRDKRKSIFLELFLSATRATKPKGMQMVSVQGAELLRRPLQGSYKTTA